MAVHKDYIIVAALDTLLISSADMGSTFTPLVFSIEMNVEDVAHEVSLTPVDAEVTARLPSAEVTLAEPKLATLAVIMNLPATNVVSSSSVLIIDSTDRGAFSWLAVGKVDSMPNSTTGIRTFNFPLARSIGTPTYNLAKLETTNLPVEFRFYANRSTGVAGTITDTEEFFMISDTARSLQIALDGGAVSQSIYTAVNSLTVSLARVVYDEATSSDTGVAIRLGKIGNASYFSSFTSGQSQAAGAVSTITLSNTTLLAGETMIVECDGGKTGTGVVTIQVEMEAI